MQGIKEIWQKNAEILGIKWSDDVEAYYDVRELRANCPCASCQEKRPSRDKIENIRPKKISSLGSYALKIDFSDGHNTGIFTFDFLRELNARNSK